MRNNDNVFTCSLYCVEKHTQTLYLVIEWCTNQVAVRVLLKFQISVRALYDAGMQMYPSHSAELYILHIHPRKLTRII